MTFSSTLNVTLGIIAYEDCTTSMTRNCTMASSGSSEISTMRIASCICTLAKWSTRKILGKYDKQFQFLRISSLHVILDLITNGQSQCVWADQSGKTVTMQWPSVVIDWRSSSSCAQIPSKPSVNPNSLKYESQYQIFVSCSYSKVSLISFCVEFW